MMHSTLHFSLGMLLATALTCRPVIAACRRGGALAAPLRRWLLAAYALGLYAIVPNLLRRAGITHDICEGWFMNVFLFSPLLNRMMQGGTISGPFVLGLFVAAQYAVLLWAVRKATAA